ncbi:MAG: acyltransferase [Actinomycetota bacterium]
MSERVPLVTRLAGSPHGGRFASLEGYRGLAALSVVVYHTRGNFHPLVTGSADVVDNLGNVGVAVFFLLSGFLLYLPVSRALFRRTEEPAVGHFLLRRFVRIYPAFWLALLGWALVIEDAARKQVKPWKIFLLVDGGLHGLGVAWTLVIEVWFYIVVAGLSVVLPKLARRCKARRGVLHLQLGLLSGMWVVAYAYRWWATAELHRWNLYSNWVFSYLDWFAYGMVMAVGVAWVESGGALPKSVKGLADRAVWCFLLAAGTYLTGLVMLVNHPSGAHPESRMSYLYRNGVHGIVALLVLLPATLGDREQSSQRWLRRPTLAALGTVSYGVYLWHTVIIRYLRVHGPSGSGFWWLMENLLITVAVTLVIATLSYRLVERPLLNLVPSPSGRDPSPPAPPMVPAPEVAVG